MGRHPGPFAIRHGAAVIGSRASWRSLAWVRRGISRFGYSRGLRGFFRRPGPAVADANLILEVFLVAVDQLRVQAFGAARQYRRAQINQPTGVRTQHSADRASGWRGSICRT